MAARKRKQRPKSSNSSDAATDERTPFGRPTKYRPEFCEHAIKRGADGYGIAQIATDLGVARSTVYEWAGEHPDFSDALTRAKVAEQAFYENCQRTGCLNPKLTRPGELSNRVLVTKFREDYYTAQNNRVSAPDGGPIGIKQETREELVEAILSLVQPKPDPDAPKGDKRR